MPTDLRQLILDRATAFDADDPVRWTPKDLAEAIHDMKWTDGKPHTCDLEEICGTLNRRVKDRPVKLEPAEATKKRHYKRAIRVSRSPETWRHLEHYPGYQISSYGRLRSAQRAKDTDVLKPRFTWHYGKVVPAYKLLDKDGIQRTRFMGTLLLNAGFLKTPQWTKKAKPENAI